MESKDRNIADILDFSISASNKSNGTTLAWSSSASSSSSSSSSSSASSALSTRVSSLSEMEEEQLIQKVVIVMYLQNIRYLKPRKAVPKSIDFYQHILPNLPDNRFIQFFRMSREGFLHVLCMIEGNIVFRNNSHNKQASPSKQLAVALRRLCTESSVSASCMNTAQIFGVSEGTVVLYTKLRIHHPS